MPDFTRPALRTRRTTARLATIFVSIGGAILVAVVGTVLATFAALIAFLMWFFGAFTPPPPPNGSGEVRVDEVRYVEESRAVVVTLVAQSHCRPSDELTVRVTADGIERSASTRMSPGERKRVRIDLDEEAVRFADPTARRTLTIDTQRPSNGPWYHLVLAECVWPGDPERNEGER